jgi:flagellar L-ring protein FlgH
MLYKGLKTLTLAILLGASWAELAQSENLYRGPAWAALASDRRASQVGDSIAVVVMHSAEARNSAARSQSRDGGLTANVNGGSVSESLDLNFSRDGAGRGEVRRSERVAAEISVLVTEVLPNGDLKVAGEQSVDVNGEATLISVSGQVRGEDIQSDNRILSSRLANARIAYNGQTFGQSGKRPKFIARLFSRLGFAP